MTLNTSGLMVSQVLTGDCREMLRTLADESVQTVVTSPPYWGLRDYGMAGQLGLEETPGEYVSSVVEVFREVRRVLRSDGTLWLNLGSSYATGGGRVGTAPGGGKQGEAWKLRGLMTTPNRMPQVGFKRKDLVAIPWMVGLALQQDGWWLRSDCIWAKPNPMPSSVTDRPTIAHEYVLLLTKRDRYFYDAAAVRTPAKSETRKMPDGWDTGAGGHGTIHREGREKGRRTDKQRGHVRVHAGFNDRWDAMERSEQMAGGAHLRTVWTIATQPMKEAHFATYPERLAEICILAGTSEYGCCADCGAPWRRVTEKDRQPRGDAFGVKQDMGSYDHGQAGSPYMAVISERTTGWEPTCGHEAGVVPCVVLDPFFGSGTTLQVAKKLGRSGIGIELNPDYCDLARRRINGVTQPLPLWTAGTHDDEAV